MHIIHTLVLKSSNWILHQSMELILIDDHWVLNPPGKAWLKCIFLIHVADVGTISIYFLPVFIIEHVGGHSAFIWYWASFTNQKAYWSYHIHLVHLLRMLRLSFNGRKDGGVSLQSLGGNFLTHVKASRSLNNKGWHHGCKYTWFLRIMNIRKYKINKGKSIGRQWSEY